MSKTLVVVQLNTLKNVWAIGMQNVGSTVRTKAQEAESGALWATLSILVFT